MPKSDTLAARAGGKIDPAVGALIPPMRSSVGPEEADDLYDDLGLALSNAGGLHV